MRAAVMVDSSQWLLVEALACSAWRREMPRSGGSTASALLGLPLRVPGQLRPRGVLEVCGLARALGGTTAVARRQGVYPVVRSRRPRNSWRTHCPTWSSGSSWWPGGAWAAPAGGLPPLD